MANSSSAAAFPTLQPFGWDDFFASAFTEPAAAELVPGRVLGATRESLRVVTPAGEAVALVPGRLLHRADSQADLPCVGDWLVLRPLAPGEPLLVEAVLPRRSLFLRRAAGRRTAVQALAANVDVAFLVMALDDDFSPRRLDRWLALTAQAGAEAVVVLNKADVAGEAAASHAAETVAAVHRVPVLVASAAAGTGVAALAPWLRPARTVALLGSSGVGKSTLANALAGHQLAATAAVAGDGRGRHTTTRRELLVLPGGALLLDTPGLREVGLWLGEGALVELFPEIEALAAGCRFRDCTHRHEPGCAVRAAAAAGELPVDRLESLRRLEGERQALLRRTDQQAAQEEKRRWREIGKAQKKHRPREM